MSRNYLPSADLKYVGSPSQHLSCPICLCPLLLPVSALTCFHTFCHTCITEALSHARICPVDRRSLSASDLQPANPIIQALVNELEIECPHHEAGCPKGAIRRDTLNTHLEDECMHTPTHCPITGCEVTLPLVEMLDHQEMHLIQAQADLNDLDDRVLEEPVRERSSIENLTRIHSEETRRSRTESLSQLNRNWSLLTNRSGRLTRNPLVQGAQDAASRHNRPLPPLPSRTPPADFPYLVRVTTSYEANNEHELTIHIGDLIRITGVRDDDWLEGNHIDSDESDTEALLLLRMFTEPFLSEEVPTASTSFSQTGALNTSTASSPQNQPIHEHREATHNQTSHGSRRRTLHPTSQGNESEEPRQSRSSTSSSTRHSLSAMPATYSMPLLTSSRSPDHNISRPPNRSQSLSNEVDDPGFTSIDGEEWLEINPNTPRDRLSHLSRTPDSAVIYHVQASCSHTATQMDDFDFQEGDIIAVTLATGDEMRGYLLDDARRQDHLGRNRIPSHKVRFFS